VAMIFLIALRIPAFAFCPCEQDLTLNNGECCQQECAVESPVSGCCSTEVPGDIKSRQNCLIVLSLDPGHFNWSGSQSHCPQGKEAPVALPMGIQSEILPAQPFVFLDGSIRGSPPSKALSVLIRTTILRL